MEHTKSVEINKLEKSKHAEKALFFSQTAANDSTVYETVCRFNKSKNYMVERGILKLTWFLVFFVLSILIKFLINCIIFPHSVTLFKLQPN